jgi:hypothetical protein
MLAHRAEVAGEGALRLGMPVPVTLQPMAVLHKA